MKTIIDVVFNRTGNFGEATFAPMFEKDYTKDLAEIDCMIRLEDGLLPANYDDNVNISLQPTSNNHQLNGNDYCTVDHSIYAELSVIDFPMHWNFRSASKAFWSSNW